MSSQLAVPGLFIRGTKCVSSFSEAAGRIAYTWNSYTYQTQLLYRRSSRLQCHHRPGQLELAARMSTPQPFPGVSNSPRPMPVSDSELKLSLAVRLRRHQLFPLPFLKRCVLQLKDQASSSNPR